MNYNVHIIHGYHVFQNDLSLERYSLTFSPVKVVNVISTGLIYLCQHT